MCFMNFRKCFEFLKILIVGLVVQHVRVALSEVRYATASSLDVLDDSMYLEVIEPEQLSYTYKVKPSAGFGQPFHQKFAGVDMLIADPIDGCSSFYNDYLIQDKVILVERGSCSFLTKAINAEDAGAVAVIITDDNINNDSDFIEMVEDHTGRSVTIPAMFMLGKDGFVIRQTLRSMHRLSAVINIPINITGMPIGHINSPPWSLF